MADTVATLLAALKASTLVELSEDDPVDEENWNQAVQAIKNLTSLCTLLKDWGCPPIGGKYIRYPGVEKTTDGVTAVLETDPEPEARWPGTVWKNIGTFYAGAFFRVEGGKASSFGSGVQADAIQGFKTKYFGPDKSGMPFRQYNEDYYGGMYEGSPISDPQYGELRLSSETRPSNLTIQIYQREA